MMNNMYPKILKKHLLHQLLIRIFISIMSTSYVHPDEYFQSIEITNKLFFGFDTYIPWEFQSENAIRTIVTPIIVTGIPYYIGSICNLIYNGWYLLISPKIMLVFLSLTIDIIGFKIHQKYVSDKPLDYDDKDYKRNKRKDAISGQTILFLFSTSWSVMVFYSRPFSNTMEAFCLAYSLGIYLLYDTSTLKRVALGFLLAFGVFTRFTFIAFFLPIGIALLLDSYYIAKRKTKKEHDARILFVTYLFQCIGGSLLGTFLNILFDSIYYNGQFTITPLNNALYNMKTENLAQHGLHPRYLHSIVNLPMLCGPLTIYLYYYGFLKRNAFGNKNYNKKNKKYDDGKIMPIEKYQSFHINTLLALCALSGMVILSLAPHQEARFLLPLVFPILLFYSIDVDNAKGKNGRGTSSSSLHNRIQYIWIIFNVILFLLFGVFHQAGVLKALNHASHTSIENNRPKNLIFYHTYMPPRFMLLNKIDVDPLSHHYRDNYIKVIDLGGHDSNLLISTLQEVKKSIDNSKQNTWIVTPASLHIEEDVGLMKYLGKNELTLEVEEEFYPHLSMEDLPNQLVDAKLVIYKL